MTEALVTAGGLVLVAVINIITVALSNSKQMVKMTAEIEKSQSTTNAAFDKAQAITETKLEALTSEVREHNNFARRMPVLEKEIEYIKRRMDEYEKRCGS